jgi:hypothetical protein
MRFFFLLVIEYSKVLVAVKKNKKIKKKKNLPKNIHEERVFVFVAFHRERKK